MTSSPTFGRNLFFSSTSMMEYVDVIILIMKNRVLSPIAIIPLEEDMLAPPGSRSRYFKLDSLGVHNLRFP